MVIAGIDEAGYGPVLGPMVIGCCALELPDVDAAAGTIPCGWKTLRRLVKRTRDPSGKRLHVNDSKLVYSPSAGLAELERAVLCLAATLHGEADGLTTFIRQTAGDSQAALDVHDWYGIGGSDAAVEAWPIAIDALALRLKANHARHELASAKCRVRHLHAHVLPESRLNALFDATQNKAATSFTFVAAHIQAMLDAFAEESLVIYCDRQGGRTHYGSLLAQMFPDWSLEIVDETPRRAAYRLTQGVRAAQIVFAERAKQECIAVALASMLSKYLREATMHRFNRWWRTHLPELKPTAGYYNDGLRFLDDIKGKCVELGIDPAALARSR